MTRSLYRWFHVSNLLVGATGLVYAWMRYLCKTDDPFSVVNHPWQPHVQHLHIITAPLIVLIIGMLWFTHADRHRKDRKQEGRRSGWTLWLSAIPMIFSGYLIQTAVSPPGRNIWIGVHLFSSFCWLMGTLIHFISHRARKPA